MKLPIAMIKYVLCVSNADCAASLEARIIYRTWPDETASRVGHLRVIDESGEDYLFPKELFVPIILPRGGRKAFLPRADVAKAASQRESNGRTQARRRRTAGM